MLVCWLFLGKSLGEQEVQADTDSPVRPAVGRLEVVATAGLPLHHLVPNPEDLAVKDVDGNGPVFRFPVVTTFGVDGEGGTFPELIGIERLDEGTVDLVAVIVARKGPDVIREEPVGAGTVDAQDNRSRPGAPLLAPEKIVGGGGQEKRGSDTPRNPLGGRLGW